MDTTRTPDEIAYEVQKALGRGLKAAAIFFQGLVRETISVPAPRKRMKTATGLVYYRATVRATPKAPPRKLSGHLRRSIEWEMSQDGKVARVGTNVKYGRVHELGRKGTTGGGLHKYLEPTLRRNLTNLAQIIGATI